MNNNLYMIIPAYNEQENIKQLVCDWYPVAENIRDAHLIIIDDGSTDNTYQILKYIKTNRPQLEILTKKNGGHGDTLLFGYRYAIEHGADWIFQTDSDGQTKASEFQGFWTLRDKYDAIFGYRKQRGDGSSRKAVEKILCLMLRLFFNVSVPDSNCPFRLMKANKVREYIGQMPKHYFLPNVMLTVFFVHHKDRVAFKSVTFENRKGGRGSLNLKKIIKVGLLSIKDFIAFRRKMRHQKI